MHPTTKKFLDATRALIEAVKKQGFAMSENEYESLDNARWAAEVSWVNAGHPDSTIKTED